MNDREFFEGVIQSAQLLREAVVLVRRASEYIETAGQRVCPECEGVSGKHAADCPLATWLGDALKFVGSVYALAKQMSP